MTHSDRRLYAALLTLACLLCGLLGRLAHERLYLLAAICCGVGTIWLRPWKRDPPRLVRSAIACARRRKSTDDVPTVPFVRVGLLLLLLVLVLLTGGTAHAQPSAAYQAGVVASTSGIFDPPDSPPARRDGGTATSIRRTPGCTIAPAEASAGAGVALLVLLISIWYARLRWGGAVTTWNGQAIQRLSTLRSFIWRRTTHPQPHIRLYENHRTLPGAILAALRGAAVVLALLGNCPSGNCDFAICEASEAQGAPVGGGSGWPILLVALALVTRPRKEVCHGPTLLR